MADTKVKAVYSIIRVLVAAILGYAVYYLLTAEGDNVFLGDSTQMFGIGGGIIVAILVFFLLTKLKGGGD
ncbi:MAG TPA: hypothetical protein PLO51_02280 [Candidatus Micrarchaeota archaeon]|nr:hypothetical protein [Candidatus Micrarchaeota archaeon]